MKALGAGYKAWSCDLLAGELIFIPAGILPHGTLASRRVTKAS